MKVILPILTGCLLLILHSGCTKPGSQTGKNTLQKESVQVSNTSISVNQDLTGKKLVKYSSGPDDTADFKIILDVDSKVKPEGEGTMSGATGNLELKGGHWSQTGNDLVIELQFSGLMSEPTEDGYQQVEKTQELKFTLPVDRIATNQAEYFEITEMF